jgi:hypothetical protein
MKRCSYCGAEYPDDLKECPIDHESISPLNPPNAEEDQKHQVPSHSKADKSSIGANIAKFVFGVIFILMGIGMFIQPVESDSFWPSTKFSAPHTVHSSADRMSIFGIGLSLLGVGVIGSIFYRSRK